MVFQNCFTKFLYYMIIIKDRNWLILISKMATTGHLFKCMLFSEIENDTLNQAELNEIKINDYHEIFEVPGQNDNPRQRTLNWHEAETLCKMSEIQEIIGNLTQNVTMNDTMQPNFGCIFSEINLDSSMIDIIILTNLIFLVSKLEVPTLNTK